MSVHPQCQAILDAIANSDGPTVFDTRDPDEARRLYAASTDAFAPPTPALRTVENRTIPSDAMDVPVRIYTPEAEAGPNGLPALLFLHGGGWVFGDLDTHDALCCILAHEAGCIIVSVDYRLAPEYKFPAALNDSLAAPAGRLPQCPRSPDDEHLSRRLVRRRLALGGSLALQPGRKPLALVGPHVHASANDRRRPGLATAPTCR